MTRTYHSGDYPVSYDTVKQIDERGQKKEKHRKCTYASRREKAHKLRDEVRRLESEVAELKVRSAEESEVDAVLKHTQEENAKLGESIRVHHLHVAKMQSTISQYLKSQQSHPLYTHISLPKDWNQRRAKLISIREEKLLNAYNFSADGDFCGIRFETVQFPGVKSLQQVYDAAIYYLTNMEISITERLGHVTVRDDYEMIDGCVNNARVLSTSHDSVTMETRSLLFPKLNPDGKYGIAVLDSIDEDELYPYNLAKWVRKDVSATAVFTARREPAVNGVEGEMIVTMRGSAFLKIHKSQFALPEHVQHDLATGIMAWGDVMVKAIRSILYGVC